MDGSSSADAAPSLRLHISSHIARFVRLRAITFFELVGFDISMRALDSSNPACAISELLYCGYSGHLWGARSIFSSIVRPRPVRSAWVADRSTAHMDVGWICDRHCRQRSSYNALHRRLVL